MMIKNIKLTIYPLFLFIPIASQGQIYLGGSMGASFANLGNNSPQVSYLSGALITDEYPLKNNNNRSAPVYSINAGYEFPKVYRELSIALGLGVYGNLGNYDFQGQVIETVEGEPRSSLYNYKYQVRATRLMAEMQINWSLNNNYGVSPFVNVGIGPTWNIMNDYHEISFNNTSYPPLLPFQSKTQSNFAYQLGVGLSKGFDFTKSGEPLNRVSVGYRYAHLGRTSFGARALSYPYSLNTGLLENNEVYISYTHLL